MTKKELEELVKQQEAIIAELNREVEQIKQCQQKQSAAMPSAPTLIKQEAHKNSPWPGFTVKTPGGHMGGGPK